MFGLSDAWATTLAGFFGLITSIVGIFAIRRKGQASAKPDEAIPVKFSPEAVKTIDRLDHTVTEMKETVAVLEHMTEGIPDLGGRVRTLEAYMKELRDGFVILRDGFRDMQGKTEKIQHDVKNIRQRNSDVDKAAAKAAALHLLRDKVPDQLKELAERHIRDEAEGE